MREKLFGVARVFGGDEIGFFENAQRSQRDVLEIPDGR
jgi:hypothetical protein